MSYKEFLNALEEILEIDEDSLSGDEELEEIEEWDSLAFISVIAFADEQFDVVIDGSRLESVVRVSDLVSLVSEHISQ